MPFSIPTLDALVQSGRATIEVNLPGCDANLKGPEMAIMDATMAHIHDALKIAQKQSYDVVPNPFMSDEAALWWQNELGIEHGEAAYATGAVRFTGVNGTAILQGSILQNNNGTEYETLAGAVIAGGEAVVDVVAKTPGKDGNMIDGQTLSLKVAIIDVDGQVTVVNGGIIGGADEQTPDEVKKQLMEFAKGSGINNGSAGTYVRVALQVPGVTSAWERKHYPAYGQIGLFFLLDGANPIIPNNAKTNQMYDYFVPRVPMVPEYVIEAPVPVTVNVSVHLYKDGVSIRNQVRDELKNLFLVELRGREVIRPSDISTAVGIAQGEESHLLISPIADIVLAPNQFAVLGSVSFV